MGTKIVNLYTVKINPDHITTETVMVSNSTLNGATSSLGVYACSYILPQLFTLATFFSAVTSAATGISYTRKCDVL